jgi:hypothetical protein
LQHLDQAQAVAIHAGHVRRDLHPRRRE